MRWEQVVGINVRRIRTECGLSQEEVAYRVGIDVSYLGQIERGRRNPTIGVLGRIAEALGAPLVSLLDRDAAEKAPDVVKSKKG
jgi:transcriptional regulator with XRE-family HTH domain